MTTDESATGILDVVFNLKESDAGSFLAVRLLVEFKLTISMMVKNIRGRNLYT
jgi:hypothetical protein